MQENSKPRYEGRDMVGTQPKHDLRRYVERSVGHGVLGRRIVTVLERLPEAGES